MLDERRKGITNDEDSAIGLGSTSDHVLDEITVVGSVCELPVSIGLRSQHEVDEADNVLTNDGDIVLGSLELSQSNVDGDTTLTLGFELVKNPGVLGSLELPQGKLTTGRRAIIIIIIINFLPSPGKGVLAPVAPMARLGPAALRAVLLQVVRGPTNETPLFGGSSAGRGATASSVVVVVVVLVVVAGAGSAEDSAISASAGGGGAEVASSCPSAGRKRRGRTARHSCCCCCCRARRSRTSVSSASMRFFCLSTRLWIIFYKT
jgi:hypothetical protein